jgi:predicted GNAT family acetyltransferase
MMKQILKEWRRFLREQDENLITINTLGLFIEQKFGGSYAFVLYYPLGFEADTNLSIKKKNFSIAARGSGELSSAIENFIVSMIEKKKLEAGQQFTPEREERLREDIENEIFGQAGTILSYCEASQLSSQYTPCIPNTMQIKYAATSDQFQNKGFGKLIYKLAAEYFKEQGSSVGITSDHDHSSSKQAKALWDSIKADPDFEFRETKEGNNTFDYDRETPDPDDDCDPPANSEPALKGSLELVADYSGILDTLIQNHEAFMQVAEDEFYDQDKYEGDLSYKASKVFSHAYKNRVR